MYFISNCLASKGAFCVSKVPTLTHNNAHTKNVVTLQFRCNFTLVSSVLSSTKYLTLKHVIE